MHDRKAGAERSNRNVAAKVTIFRCTTLNVFRDTTERDNYRGKGVGKTVGRIAQTSTFNAHASTNKKACRIAVKRLQA